MLRGSDELKRVCQSKIHHDQFHLNASGTLSWEEVECLGACVNAPMVMIFKDTYEDLTAERLSEIIDAFDRGEGDGIKVGPQIDRHLSAPIGGPTSLTSDDSSNSDDGIEHGGSSAAAAKTAEGQAPSQAGRPSTHAAETDPSIKSPGAAVGAAVDQRVENAESAGATSASAPAGTGATGGSVEGPTGAGQKEEGLDNHASASADAGVARRDGPLGDKGQRDETAVVADSKFVEAPQGSAREIAGDRAPAADAASGVREEPPVEQLRRTEDTLPGPVADDHFESDAERADAPASFVTPQKPSGLLSAPEGSADDLKLIKGVGPVLEVKLNELGIYHIRQIAGLSTAEIQWLDDHLNLRGRTLRDRWVEQAKALAAPAGRD
jgi:predicted flap endonuclease-1-like 5' DNA nuclease